MIRVLSCALIGLTLAGCARVGGPYPSLRPRAAEAVDPRVPVDRPINDRPVTAAVAGQLATLVNEARRGDSAFAPLAGQAERLAATAGAAQSESWIAAQQAMSAAVAARGPTVQAIADIDALAARLLADQGGLAPNELGAVEAAAAEAGGIERRQAARIAAIQRRLGI